MWQKNNERTHPEDLVFSSKETKLHIMSIIMEVGEEQDEGKY